MKHNKLKIHKVKDKGLSIREYAELGVLIMVCISMAAAVLAFLIAAIKVVSEQL